MVSDTDILMTQMVSDTDILMTQMVSDTDTLVTHVVINTNMSIKQMVSNSNTLVIQMAYFCEEIYSVREKGVTSEFCKMYFKKRKYRIHFLSL
jgi:CRISPR/Cas system endoribonuclease Cas6 (RAMP superfamily)